MEILHANCSVSFPTKLKKVPSYKELLSLQTKKKYLAKKFQK